MRYRLYKIKEEIQGYLYGRLLLHNTSEDEGLYLYISKSSDYFKIVLEGMWSGWRFTEVDRLELVNYDLIDQFDEPHDSIVLREEYENYLWKTELMK